MVAHLTPDQKVFILNSPSGLRLTDIDRLSVQVGHGSSFLIFTSVFPALLWSIDSDEMRC